jgi:hypothetical protein
MENDRAFAAVLNDCLDAIEAGQASVEDCLARYPQHAARLEDLLRLSEEARTLSFPAPTPEVLAVGERQLVDAARSMTAERSARERDQGLRAALSGQFIAPLKAAVSTLPRWVLPVASFSGAAALLFVCVILAAIGGTLAWRGLHRPDVTPAAIAQEARDATPVPSPTAAESVAHYPTPLPEPTAVAKADATEPPGYKVFLPFGSAPQSPDVAVLDGIQGLVEVQGADGTWSVVRAREALGSGTRVRTGALSRAELSFYDGSAAYLGPDTELSIDALGQDPEDRSRIVELTQWAGEADHDVAPAYGSNARYEVHTPSGTGEAKGTFFHVSVTLAQVVRFWVDDGAVAVTYLDVTVLVVAGQSTTIHIDEPPAEPVFQVSGEGELEAMGTIWRVAGQDFTTDESTVIVGSPQLGDWVRIEGHLLPDGTRVADRIVLLRRALLDRFTIVGEVQATGTLTWTVAGQEIAVDGDTEIDEGIHIGDRVRVEGLIQDRDGAALLAETIVLLDEQGLPFSFSGVVQEIEDAYWLVSGISVTVDSQTTIDPDLAAGNVVRVRGVFLDRDGGTWLARSIAPLLEMEPRFEFVGLVEQVDSWVVSGIPLVTRPWTEIDGSIEVGDRVSEIELLDVVPGLTFAFVGTVQGIDPWVVSGISLTVDARTEIVGQIEVGDQVKVEGRILPGGEWLATEIRSIDRHLGRGCLLVTSLVVRVSTGEVVLQDGSTIALDTGVQIDGSIQANSVIALYICVDDRGNVTIISIIVLYQIQPVIIVHPPSDSHPPPPGDDQDHQGDEEAERKVTICHKAGGKSGGGHTIVVAWSAWLNGHSQHGDTLGPCR